METWQIAAISAACTALIGAVAWMIYARNRSRRLRERFGPEYDRRVTEIGSTRRAESELTQREARVQSLKMRPLSVSDRERFLEQWRMCQTEFVDAPVEAVDEADRLLADIMHARGYAVDDPNDRLADLCAAYPDRASDFREANEILIKNRHGHASTEELRKAFVRFRSLFEEMIGGQNEEFKRAS